MVIQRVRGASVSVEKKIVGGFGDHSIGLLVFLGIGEGDDESDADWITSRLLKLRIFDDEAGRMNLNILEVDGEALVISQFTLFGSLKKGNRPSYNRASPPSRAVPLYEYFIAQLSEMLGKPVSSGQFGAHMVIDAVNDGPVTLIIDSRERDF